MSDSDTKADAELDSGVGDEFEGEEESGAEGRLADARVLIVDDDPDIRQSFDIALQSEGALTMAVGDGNAAVDVCRSDPPDVVILDMMLPGRSGFLALERIKGKDDSPAVIMVTANDGKRHQAYAESLGVDGYLIKPVPLGKLIESIEDLLDQMDEQDDRDGD